MPRRINWSEQEVRGLCQSWQAVLEVQEEHISSKELANLAAEHYHQKFGHNFERDEKAAFTKLRKLQRFIEFMVSFSRGDESQYENYYKLGMRDRKKLLKDQFYRVDEIPEVNFKPIFSLIKRKMSHHLIADLDSNSTSRNENSLPELLEGTHGFENSLSLRGDSENFDSITTNLRSSLLLPKRDSTQKSGTQFTFVDGLSNGRLRKLDILEPQYDPVTSPKSLKMRRLENFDIQNDISSNHNESNSTSVGLDLNPKTQSQMLKGVLEEHFKQLEHVFEQSNRKLLENLDKIFEL